MRPVVLCDEDLIAPLVGISAFPAERTVYLVESPLVRGRIARRGERVLSGDLNDPSIYQQAFKLRRGPVVVAANPSRFARIVATVNEAASDTAILVIRDDDRSLAGTTTLSLAAFEERVVQPALDRASQRA